MARHQYHCPVCSKVVRVKFPQGFGRWVEVVVHAKPAPDDQRECEGSGSLILDEEGDGYDDRD